MSRALFRETRQQIKEMRRMFRDPVFRDFFRQRGGWIVLAIPALWFTLTMSLAVTWAITDWAWAQAGALGLLFGWKLHHISVQAMDVLLGREEEE